MRAARPDLHELLLTDRPRHEFVDAPEFQTKEFDFTLDSDFARSIELAFPAEAPTWLQHVLCGLSHDATTTAALSVDDFFDLIAALVVQMDKEAKRFWDRHFAGLPREPHDTYFGGVCERILTTVEIKETQQ